MQKFNKFISMFEMEINNWIELPFYREMMLDYPDIQECTDFPKMNYTSYDLFCLKTRISPVARELFGALATIEYQAFPVENAGRMQIFLGIFSVDAQIVLNSQQHHLLKEAVNIALTSHASYSLLFETSTAYPFTSKSVYLPAAWLRSLFDRPTFFSLLENESVEALDFLMVNGNLLARFSEDDDYETDYYTALDKIENVIWKLWKKGTVVTDEAFAQRWNLSLIAEEEQQHLDDLAEDMPLRGIYQANWFDSRIGMGVSDFLLRQLVGPFTLYINIRSNPFVDDLVEKHHIAFRLLEMSGGEEIPEILEGTVALNNVKNYDDLFDSMQAIFADRTRGKVILRSVLPEDIEKYNAVLSKVNAVESVAYYKVINGNLIYSIFIAEENFKQADEINTLLSQINMKY